MKTAEEKETVAIYVGTYKNYNNGYLFGKWVNLDDYPTKEDFFKKCQEIHNDEPPNELELMFQDWEGIPKGYITECHIVDELWEFLDLKERERDIVRAYQENDSSITPIEEILEDKYIGEYNSLEDYAAETGNDLHTYLVSVLIQGLVEYPQAKRAEKAEILLNYFQFDKKGYANDLQHDSFFVHNGYLFQ
jgi:antirestriction protein